MFLRLFIIIHMEKWQNPQVILLWIIITLFLLVILVVFISYLIKLNFKKTIEKNEIVFQERLKTEKQLKEAIIITQENERKMIASELHDQISNKLNLIVLKLNTLEPESYPTELKIIRDDLKNLIKKNRDLTHYLFPVEIDNLGLMLCLKEMCYSSNEFSIRLYASEEIHFPSKLVEHQLYRVIQEFITNSIKHSQGSEITIHLKLIKEKLYLRIADNGVGIDLTKIKHGLGINNTETRLSAIDAHYKYKSAPGQGTRLIISL